MPTLNWIGKEKVINHHQDVPYRILERKYHFDAKNGETRNSPPKEGRGEASNKIIHGDNLEALKSLLPEYEGKIKCIYIDPPYNTGNEGWVYNDNVSDPKLKKWLGQVVGKESEDLSRHDKWLCMMYPRLKLLHKLLADDGIFVAHIDENEYPTILIILEEIFGKGNNLGTIIWDKKNPKGDAKKISYQHESIIIFSKNADLVREQVIRKKKNASKILDFAKKVFAKFGKESYPEDILQICKKYKLDKSLFTEQKFVYDLETINTELAQWINNQDFSGGEKAYKMMDSHGEVYQSVSMAWPNKKQAPEDYFIPLIHPLTNKACPVPARGWRNPAATMQDLLEKDLILFGKDETTQPRRKYLLKENMFENISSVIGFAGSDDEFQKQIGIKLENPKPHLFATEIVGWFTDSNSIVLDSFAGSGTTAHAVLNLNKADGGNRKFIMIEMEDYANDITAERVKRVMKGYGVPKNPPLGGVTKGGVQGTGGDFSFYELGEPVFLENDELNEAIGTERIAEYVWYTETKAAYVPQTEAYFLGKQFDTAYYFFYEKETPTTLNEAFLRSLQTKAQQYIIYADLCLLDKPLMDKYHIVFKKIPRDITRF